MGKAEPLKFMFSEGDTFMEMWLRLKESRITPERWRMELNFAASRPLKEIDVTLTLHPREDSNVGNA